MISSGTLDLLRGFAMLLAMVAGAWHVADLWFDGLSRETLTAASRGGVLLLLSLGLMGTGRLALALVVAFCGLSIWEIVAAERALPLVMWLEVGLLIIAALLLVTPTQAGETS